MSKTKLLSQYGTVLSFHFTALTNNINKLMSTASFGNDGREKNVSALNHGGFV